MKFGTIIADPPWNYSATSKHEKLSGYSDSESANYLTHSMTTKDLCDLPVKDLAGDESVLFLWTTWPFLFDALEIVEAWGFNFVTGFPYFKLDKRGHLNYGVGHWFRHCTEPVIVGASDLLKREMELEFVTGECDPILVGKRKKSYRSNQLGIVSEAFAHSRKPDHIHEMAENGDFPKPYLEIFGRRARPGWTVVGNQAPGCEGEDIRVSLDRLESA